QPSANGRKASTFHLERRSRASSTVVATPAPTPKGSPSRPYRTTPYRGDHRSVELCTAWCTVASTAPIAAPHSRPPIAPLMRLRPRCMARSSEGALVYGVLLLGQRWTRRERSRTLRAVRDVHEIVKSFSRRGRPT